MFVQLRVCHVFFFTLPHIEFHPHLHIHFHVNKHSSHYYISATKNREFSFQINNSWMEWWCGNRRKICFHFGWNDGNCNFPLCLFFILCWVFNNFKKNFPHFHWAAEPETHTHSSTLGTIQWGNGWWWRQRRRRHYKSTLIRNCVLL